MQLSNIKHTLQIMNCCAAKKAASHIALLEKGKPCGTAWEDAKEMFMLIDALTGFVPEGKIIGGNQATYQIQITNTGNPSLDMDINISIGSAVHVISVGNSPTRTDVLVASKIAQVINAQYPHGYPYYASASGAFVLFSGSDFDNDNGTAVSVSVNNGNIVAAAPLELFGGTPKIVQGKNCISNQDAKNIVNKLKKLCSTPCEKIMNFSLN